MAHDEFEDQHCVSCFVKFRVPVGFSEMRRKDKATFYCPNGHSMSYNESSEDRLRRERDRLQQKIAEKDDEIRFANQRREEAEKAAEASKKQAAKLKKRAAAGVCPCCNRTFLALHKHMAEKHPEILKETGTSMMCEVVPLRKQKQAI